MNTYLRGELQEAIEQRIMTGTTYLGIETRKHPVDAWVYQEIIFETKPDTIIEIGNHHGGALLYLADLLSLTRFDDDHGLALGVDIDHEALDSLVLFHDRADAITGDALAVFDRVAERVQGKVLVIEDSAHTYDHTLAVARLYSQLVQPGGYLIIEDGVMPDVAHAIDTFLAESPEFEADRSREWPITWNPNGYLRRVS